MHEPLLLALPIIKKHTKEKVFNFVDVGYHAYLPAKRAATPPNNKSFNIFNHFKVITKRSRKVVRQTKNDQCETEKPKFFNSSF